MPGQNFKSEMANMYTVEFPGALRAALVLSQVIQTSTGQWNCRIDGTHGTIIIPDILSELELYSKKLGGSPYKFHWDRNESLVGINGVIGGHAAHMVDLVNAIFESREPISSGRDNLDTVRVYLAAKRSAQERRVVRPDEISA
jgi:predicted dehydrogenase